MQFAATWIDLPEITLSTKDKYHMISLKSGIKKMSTNELIYKTDSYHLRTNLCLPKGKPGVGVGNK